MINLIVAALVLLCPILSYAEPNFFGFSGQNYFSVSGFAVSMEDMELTTDNPGFAARVSAASANAFEAKTSAGFGGALALGFDFTGPWRVEGELSLRVVSLDHISIDGIPLVIDVNRATEKIDTMIPITSLMQNVYYDFSNFLLHSPYIGGGVGLVLYHTLGVGDDDALGYQFMIGMNTPINKNATLGAEYRYFSSTDPEVLDITGPVDIHSFGFRLQYFWDSLVKKIRKKK